MRKKADINLQTSPDLPASAWELLFLVTLERLRKCKPRWADITEREAHELELTWHLCGFAHGGTPRAERWLSDVQEFVHQRKLPKRGAKPKEPSPEWLLMKYRILHEGIWAMRKAEREENPRNRNKFYRQRLPGLLNELGPVWLDGKLIYRASTIPVTESMIDACLEEPSQAAFLILGAVFRRGSGGRLKADFVQVRKSANPLLLWQQVMHPPRQK